MARAIVKDFLGHPCRTTEAFENFASAIEEARRDNARDDRLVARQVGIEVLNVQTRITHLCALIEAMKKHIPLDNDSDDLLAMIEAGSEYATVTSERFWKFAGVTLLALEKGAQWSPAKEVQHG